jgi:NAD(P)-dependent dehydrogenase (short-subunit alcohol dehydrogenase family)
MEDLNGRVAVVTGGASGVGKGVAKALLGEGCTVVLADIEQGALDTAVAELSALGPVSGIVTDVSDFDSVDALAEQVYAEHGACHLLFNNAGVTSGGGGKPWEQEPNDWKWCLGVNVFGVVNGVLAFVPRMLESGEWGRVINTSSGDGGFAPVPHASVYATSKAAVSCFTEALAQQLVTETDQVRAIVFYPSGGLLDTGLWTAQRNRPEVFYLSGGLLDTGLWTAQRNRPEELARQKQREAARVTTIEDFKKAMAEAGRELKLMDVDELGVFCVEGIKAGRYIISHDLDDVSEMLHQRADAIGRAELPPLFMAEIS